MSVQPGNQTHEIDSVVLLLRRFRSGDADAATLLWGRYYPQVVQSIMYWFGRRPRPVVDEEDLALDVIDRVLRRVISGQLDEIGSRDDFARILLLNARGRVFDEYRARRRIKRGRDQVENYDPQVLDRLAEGRVDDTAVLECQESFEHLLELLENGTLRTIARLRMDGCTVSEIAETLGLSSRSVERRLRQIRYRWILEWKRSSI